MATQEIGGTQPYTPASSTTGSLFNTPNPTAPVQQTAPSQPGAAVPTGLDPKIVTLAKAIRQTESQGNFQAKGASGEYGAYQFLDSTWASTAPKYGVSTTLEQATPQQQNEVAYKQLAEWSQQHPDWNVGNFASAWNAGPGKPSAYLEGNSGTNAEGVKYDTAAYAKQVAQNYQQFKSQNTAQQGGLTASPLQQAPDSTSENPSIQGFLGNVVKSGASLLGGIGEAALHPITTVQNLASIPVGGLEKLAGNTNDETQKFDSFTNYFKQRYGGTSNIENSLYTDPVGVLADLSTALGLGGGALGLTAKAAKLGGLGEVGNLAAKGVEATEASGVAGALKTAGNALNKGSEYTNPLTLPIKGGITAASYGSGVLKEGLGQILGQSKDVVQFVMDHPDLINDETLRNTSRTAIAQDVEAALNLKESELGEAGAAYEPIKTPQVSQAGTAGFEGLKNNPHDNAIPVTRNFLEDQIRSVGKLDVEDGEIKPTTISKVGKNELSKLQDVLDTFKPAFQRGYLSPEEFLTLRKRLDNAAFNDSGIKNTNLADIAAGVRTGLNDTYRKLIPGLEEADNEYSAKSSELKILRKGVLDKNGDLLDSAINKIANASGKGKDQFLERLEQITPGITLRLQALKTIEELNSSGIKVGAYTRSILQAGRTGAAVFGAATGNIKMLAGALTMDIISQPKTAVAIMKAVAKVRPEVVAPVLANLAKFAVRGVVANNSTSYLNSTTPTNTQAGNPQNTLQQSATDQISGQTQNPNQEYNQSSLDSLASTNNFDLASARAAGYSDAQIEAYLENQ